MKRLSSSNPRPIEMVWFHVKADGEEELQFHYECSCVSSIKDITNAILEIYNLQSCIQTLCHHLRRDLLTVGFREKWPDVVLALDRTLSEAETYTSKEQVLHKRVLSPHILRDHIQTIQKEVKDAYSRGVSESILTNLTFDPDLHKKIQLIWAGRELLCGKKLCDYIGENEKTKITVKVMLGCMGL